MESELANVRKIDATSTTEVNVALATPANNNNIEEVVVCDLGVVNPM